MIEVKDVIEFNDLTGRYEPVGDPVLISEAPYVTGEASSLADFSDELVQEIEKVSSDMGIENDAECPKCKCYMDMWGVAIEPPIVVEVISTGYRYRISRHHIFCCPKCGNNRHRINGDESNLKQIGICPSDDRLEPCDYCKTPCALVKS